MAMAVGFAEAYQTGLDVEDQVVEGLWAGNHVEGGGQRAALVKVGDPQLGSGKLPLYVGVLLQRRRRRVERKLVTSLHTSVCISDISTRRLCIRGLLECVRLCIRAHLSTDI